MREVSSQWWLRLTFGLDGAGWVSRSLGEMNREHRVPLTGRALDILGGRGSPLVFPMRGKPLRNAALSRLLKRFDPTVEFAGRGYRPRFVAIPLLRQQ